MIVFIFLNHFYSAEKPSRAMLGLRSIGKFGFRFWIRISWISFLPFDWEIRKRICKTVLVNGGLPFANYACECKTAVLKDSFSNSFSDFLIERQKWKSKNRYLSVEIRFRISRSIAIKSEVRILKFESRFPKRKHPNTILPSKFIAKSRPSLRLIWSTSTKLMNFCLTRNYLFFFLSP